MQEGFKKFKKKIILETVIKSLIFGLSAGLMAFSIPLIIMKSQGNAWDMLYYLLIGFGTFLILTNLAFWLLRPNDVKIAKRLDKTFVLNEKVQTMIKFNECEGLIIDLQRADTNEHLLKIDLKSLSLKIGLFFIIIPIIATALCVTAFAIPTYEEGPTEVIESEPFESDNWIVQALKDLIEEVEKSNLNDEVKSAYLVPLNELLDTVINQKVTTSEMEQKVLKTIDDVYQTKNQANYSWMIATVFKSSTEPIIITLGVYLENYSLRDIDSTLDTIRTRIDHGEGIVSESCARMHQVFGKALEKSQLDQTNALNLAFQALSEEMGNCVDAEGLKVTFDKHKQIINPLLEAEYNNHQMAIYIEETLRSIFGLYENVEEETNPTDDLPTNNGANNDQTETKPTGDGQGGLGDGKTDYPANDMIFDPDLGKVSYNDVYNDYYSKIYNQFLDGSIPQEYEEFFNDYFEILNGTNKE